MKQQVPRWDVLELRFEGRASGNPFVDVRFGAVFTCGDRRADVPGFYDGGGRYIVRFSPDREGVWSYVTNGSDASLDGVGGGFECVPASGDNHGPVRVRDTYHFAYADGTPYYPFGTTCYAWVHQPEALQQQTLKTLAAGPFNKLRMGVFPKHYIYNSNEPEMFAFEKQGDGFDFTRFNPAFYRMLEQRIAALRDMNIEADLILFHPYDRWGFERMDAGVDEAYLRYTIARLGAYRNVWWSAANEWDMMKHKREADFDRFGSIMLEADPHDRLRSVHHCFKMYDHGQSWVTHVSTQSSDLRSARDVRGQFNKPVIYDECKYEGDIPLPWGCISGRELIHRFWLGFSAGTYVGHGDTFLADDEVLWWSKGGVLKGESSSRIAFLRSIIGAGPSDDIDLLDTSWVWRELPGGLRGADGRYLLCYLGEHQPRLWQADLGHAHRYRAEVIDPWAMTVTPAGEHTGPRIEVELPGRPYLALRLTAID